MIEERFTPNWASPPGDSLADLLEERGITQRELSLKLGRSGKNLNQVVNGKAPITPELALGLERVLGTPARFWNAREANYRDALIRLNIKEPTSEEIAWARTFPYLKMVAGDWVPATKTVRSKFLNLIQFFGVVDLASYHAWQASLCPHYRRSPTSGKTKDNLVAAWLRQGEIQASRVETNPYSASAFEAAVHEARKLTCDEPAKFSAKLVNLFADAGVALLFVPELPAMGVWGATRWLGTKPVIQVTLHYKTNDHFWFTIFHESCHILKHQKKAVFLETEKNHSVEEEEANLFARNLLIPPTELRSFVKAGKFDASAIKAFAKSIGICPGIVVGRLQHDGLVPFMSPLNSFKVKYQWNQS